MNDDLLHDLGAVGRLDARLHAAEDSPDSVEDRWTKPACDRQRRERLVESFVADGLTPPPARRRPRWIAVALSMGFATAAALLLAWPPGAWQLRGSTLISEPHGVSLGYVLSVEGGAVAQRGAPAAETVKFGGGDGIHLRLIPPMPMDPSVDVRVSATLADRHVELAWPWRVDSFEGVIEVDGRADDLLRVASGTWTLSVTLREDAPPHRIRDRLRARVVIAP